MRHQLPTLGHLQDALPEECHAGPSLALALQEYQPMDLAFGDAVAPREGEPRDDGHQMMPSGRTMVATGIPCLWSVCTAS